MNSAIIKGDIKYHIALIKSGKNVMPAYIQTLHDKKVAEVAACERNAWVNQDLRVFAHSQK